MQGQGMDRAQRLAELYRAVDEVGGCTWCLRRWCRYRRCGKGKKPKATK